MTKNQTTRQGDNSTRDNSPREVQEISNNAKTTVWTTMGDNSPMVNSARNNSVVDNSARDKSPREALEPDRDRNYVTKMDDSRASDEPPPWSALQLDKSARDTSPRDVLPRDAAGLWDTPYDESKIYERLRHTDTEKNDVTARNIPPGQFGASFSTYV